MCSQLEISNKDKNKIVRNQQYVFFVEDNFELPEGNILAPMAGVTDSPYRRISRRFGSGLLYSECISAEGVRRLGTRSLELAGFHEDERPIAIQLFGSDPQQFHDAAAVIAEKFNPELIDINCGCPVRKMLRNSCGGFLMRDPDLIGRIVEAARSGSGLNVSVKLRSGFDQQDETAVRAAVAAEEAGASLVAVHARFVKKTSDHKADWEVISKVKSALKRTPLIGNGDVKSLDDAHRMKQITGCERVMIGRAALGNPWIFEEDVSSSASIEDRITVLLDHYNLMLAEFPEKTTVYRMRKHIGWYIRGLPGAVGLRSRVMNLKRADDVKQLLLSYMSNYICNNPALN